MLGDALRLPYLLVTILFLLPYVLMKTFHDVVVSAEWGVYFFNKLLLDFFLVYFPFAYLRPCHPCDVVPGGFLPWV